MLLKSVQIKNFRNLNIDAQFQPGINIILGLNGAGKSNFLDSLYYLAFAKSFKKYSEKNNITYLKPAEFASIESLIENDQGASNLKIVFSNDLNGFERKRLEVNKRGKARNLFTGNLYLTLFAPHNINLLGGTPEMRREELDDFIGAVDRKYENDLSEYKRVIRNRNMVLSRIGENRAERRELAFWNDKMIELGSYVLGKRKEIVAEFTPFIKKEANEFERQLEKLELHYSSKIDLENDDIRTTYQRKIDENSDKEIMVGKSLYGPHRDDYDFISEGKNLKIYASRGQQRIATMIFKTAMWHYMLDVNNIKAILLLDDIMSELDPENKERIEHMVNTLDTQTVITATNKNEFTYSLLESAQIIELAK